MLLGRAENIQCCSVDGFPSGLDVEFFPKSTEELRLVIDNREHSAKEQQVAGLHRLDVTA
jgi:hypothetical protein